ncbi:MAG: N-acetyl-gamma-glutamyl-phosphate reductase [Actinomyces sp.]|nr:MAG: N-acetyl-gamma-glutamyl-phosphate reductase [Actinomyces sp.]
MTTGPVTRAPHHEAADAGPPIGVVVIGGSGYTGAELLRLCAGHPRLEVRAATADTNAGAPIAAVHPGLAPLVGDRTFAAWSPDLLDDADLVFCALPHGASQDLVPEIRGRVDHLVDLAADFRLDDPGAYPVWYGEEHTAPDLLDDFVYGLPELFRERIRGAELVAAPGCYVTTATLALAPVLAAGLAEPTGIVVDAASGVSGAGRTLRANTAFCAVDEDVTAYGLLTHRHTPEIEMALRLHAGTEVQVLFTPHLVPTNRGILATCYSRPARPGVTSDEVLDALRGAYADEPFVVVTPDPPHTKATLGANSVHVTGRADPRTGWIVTIAALDNLVKGASGQAVQCANLALGLDETAGLPAAGLWP